MSIETLEVEAAQEQAPFDPWTLQWTPIVAGAFTACAVSSIMLTFGTTVGLGVSSSAPTWRDASFALWLLSGIYLMVQALISFGCGGYLAGRCRVPYDAVLRDEIERRDGLHGIATWALAVLLGVGLTALVALSVSQPTNLTQPKSTTEPSVLSYEIDQLFRSTRRPPNADVTPLRSEAGRILMTSSSHGGVSADDRTYLAQLVTATTGLSGPDAERRVDTAINNSRTAIARARAALVILAFFVATALLLGAAAAWAAAEAGGRHRDGMPLSDWMQHANRFNRRQGTWQRSPKSLPG
jgi:hypothetical protein